MSGHDGRRNNLSVVRILRHLDESLFDLTVVIALFGGDFSQVLNVLVREIALVEQEIVVELHDDVRLGLDTCPLKHLSYVPIDRKTFGPTCCTERERHSSQLRSNHIDDPPTRKTVNFNS